MKKLFTYTWLHLLSIVILQGQVQYYVSPDGNDNNDGLSLATAFASTYRVAPIVNPGDTVWFANGVYNQQDLSIQRSGTPEAYITFKSINKHGAKITNTWGNTITIGSSTSLYVGYIIIDGFELVAPATYGNGVASGWGAHHIIVRNCWAHSCGQSGIQLNEGDYRIVENNITNNNGYLMPHAGSGISLYGMVPFDNEPGWHSIVRNNISFGNINGPTTANTDGNGIIIDDFRMTQGFHNLGSININYTGLETLVENNLVYWNGGAGIQIFVTNNVTVRNNTSYLNQRRRTTETWRGNISVSCSYNVNVYNNISVVSSDPLFDGGSTSWSSFSHNTAIGAFALSGNSYGGNYSFHNNITYDLHNITSPSIKTSGVSVNIAGVNGNITPADPLFVSPGSTASANFRLLSNSPAIDSGTSVFGLPNWDLDGSQRVIGSAVDMGSYEYNNSGAFIPVIGVSVSPVSASIFTGTTLQLTATLQPSDVTNPNVSWSSTNASVATVNANGLVTAVAAGTASITVTTQDGGFTATSEITVNVAPPVATLLIEGEDFSSKAPQTGGCYTCNPAYVGEFWGGNWAAYQNIDLGSGYTQLTMRIATTSNGRLELRLGSDTGPIIAELNFTSTGGWDIWQEQQTVIFGGTGMQIMVIVGNASVNVDWFELSGGSSTISVTGVSVSPSTLSLLSGSTEQLTATIFPSDATDQSLSWSTSNSAVATVNGSGLVTAVASGNTTITVTTQDGSYTATTTVYVSEPLYELKLEAELFDQKSAGVTTCLSCNPAYAGEFWKKGWISFQNVDLGTGYSHLNVRLATRNSGTLEVRDGSSSGPVMSSLNYTSTGGWNSWSTFQIPLSGASGTKNVYVGIKGNSSCNIDYIEFTNNANKSGFLVGESENKSSDIRVYPNPIRVGENLHINYLKSEEFEFLVFDLTGKIIYQDAFFESETVAAHELSLETGIYFIRITTENVSATRKLVVY